jgi:steroid 5-alpha reductase family enzyme
MTPAATDILLTSLGVSAVLFFIAWIISVIKKDASIVDILWGPACALPGLVTYLQIGGRHPQQLLLTVLVGLWGLRLALYLARRNLPHGEDIRYTHMRKRAGSDRAFALRSLVTVFALQCVLSWFISFPVQFGQMGLPAGQLGSLAYAGALLWLIGLVFEAVGDRQLAAFKADPANKGKLMTSGLWSWTRHPNYFGDACVWFGLALIALESPYGIYALASPFVMALFLVKISGKALTEKLMRRKSPDYAAYQARTSGFIPLPPKKS